MCVLDLLQVLSILTMERPVSFSAEDIRDEKVCRITNVIVPVLTCVVGQGATRDPTHQV